MSIEETILSELRRLPISERKRTLHRIDALIDAETAMKPVDLSRAVAAVHSTWASVALDEETLVWAAEDKELEYDVE